jgi:GTP-binding protein
VNDYLLNRPNLCLVFALIESGLTPQKMDLEFVEWLARHAVPFVLVFTKTDKVSAVAAQANIAAFTDRVAAWFEKLPAVFTCSAKTRQGRSELLGVIADEMTAINTGASLVPAPPESSPNPSLKARVRQNRKVRPDLHRPW